MLRRGSKSYAMPFTANRANFLKDAQLALSWRNSVPLRHIRNGFVDFSSAIVDDGRAP